MQGLITQLSRHYLSASTAWPSLPWAPGVPSKGPGDPRGSVALRACAAFWAGRLTLGHDLSIWLKTQMPCVLNILSYVPRVMESL